MTDPSQPSTQPVAPGDQPWSSGAPASPLTPTGAPNWPAAPPGSAAAPYWTPPESAAPTGTPYSPAGAPTWPAVPPTGPPTVRPPAPASGRGRGLRVAGWVLVIVSVVGGMLMFAFGTYRVVRSATDLQRVPAAVGGPVTVDSPGVYAIYYEPGALARYGDDGGDPDVQAVGPDGTVATVTPPGGEFSYSFGDRAGHKIAELTADRPGRYQVETQSADLLSGELSVGEDLGGLFAAAFIGAGVAIVIFLVGLVLMIVGYVRRRPRY